MSRTSPDMSPLESAQNGSKLALVRKGSSAATSKGAWLLRTLLVGAASGIAYALAPSELPGWVAACSGAVFALLVILAEHFLRAAASVNLLGGAIGGLLGAVGSLLITGVLARTAIPEPARSLLECFSLLGFGYAGVMIGFRQARQFAPSSFAAVLPARAAAPAASGEAKLLDTSVLIDGRIADICEAHFLDGPLLVPQFVLRELQAIADSAETLRRQRGRRGLDVLDRMRKMRHLELRILDDDSRSGGEVDRQLVEVAQRLNAKIVTNDFNLNKVASVQGISVLNINLLANALRPAVLPGEGMRVFILREGKEVNQGVAYLEDGTMVVVDGARRLINKTVDICVTSVHQTPAGKMIFGRLEDRTDPAATPLPPSKQAAVGGRTVRPAFPEPSE